MLHLKAPLNRRNRGTAMWVGALLMFIGMPAWIAPSGAQDTTLQLYEVELVIFRVINPTGSPEDWAMEETRAKSGAPVTHSGEQPIAATTETATPATGSGNDSSIQPLESGRLKLTPIETTLKRSRSYQPLAHFGWTQPGFGLESPRPLGIEGFVSSDAGVTGTVTLTKGRYLRLTLDLTWQSPVDGKRYVLREQRDRMRSSEKHYFDHPYFGVVAIVTPKVP
jgi:hypothetical protein